MRKIFIVTETGGDLLKEDIEKYGICIVPMHVSMEGKSLDDGAFPTTDIFDSYKRTKKLPMTSATNPAEYKDMFENDTDYIANKGYNGAIDTVWADLVASKAGVSADKGAALSGASAWIENVNLSPLFIVLYSLFPSE